MSVGKKISWKMEEGKQYHLPFNIESVGKNIKWKTVEGDGKFGEEN